MKLSTYALEAMGFRQMDSPASITARFYSCHVYEIRGFLVEADLKECFCGKLGEAAYKFSIGTSVNDICKILAGDGFVDNEEGWQSERKCTPPYLVIFVGPYQRIFRMYPALQKRSKFSHYIRQFYSCKR